MKAVITQAHQIPVTDDDLLAAIHRLPVSVRVMNQLLAMLLDFNSDLLRVGAVIEKDPVLTGRLLQVANSPLYGRGVKVHTIDDALSRLGFGEVYRLAGVVASAQIAEENPLEAHCVDVEAYRTYNLALALSAARFAEKIGADARVAYIAGLMRTVGMAVLETAGRSFWVIPPVDGEKGAFNISGIGSVLDWECRIYGASYLAVTEMVMTQWGATEDIIDAATATLESCADHQAASIPNAGRAVLMAEAFVATKSRFSIGSAYEGMGAGVSTPLVGFSDEFLAQLKDCIVTDLRRFGLRC